MYYSTGQPLRTYDQARSSWPLNAGGGSSSRQTSSTSNQPHQLLVSAGSSLLRELYTNSNLAERLGRGHGGRDAPDSGEPQATPVPVLEQESVLNLSHDAT